MESTALTMYERSGARVFPRGVGTQIRIASISLRRDMSPVAVSLPDATAGRSSSSVTSTRYDRPA